MKDIVTRLRNWRTVHLARLHLLMEEAADEMERLRADWPEQLAAHSVLIAEQEMEIERLRLSARADCPEPENAASEDKVFLRQNMTVLTRQERDVLREVCRVYADEDDAGCNEIAYVIDRILERLGGAANSTPDHREACGESRTGSVDAKAGEDVATCTVTSAKLPERERLTDAEREAVQRARDAIAATMPYESVQSAEDWKALRGLLERLGGGR